jgi:hypothetical protein
MNHLKHYLVLVHLHYRKIKANKYGKELILKIGLCVRNVKFFTCHS